MKLRVIWSTSSSIKTILRTYVVFLLLLLHFKAPWETIYSGDTMKFTGFFFLFEPMKFPGLKEQKPIKHRKTVRAMRTQSQLLWDRMPSLFLFAIILCFGVLVFLLFTCFQASFAHVGLLLMETSLFKVFFWEKERQGQLPKWSPTQPIGSNLQHGSACWLLILDYFTLGLLNN